MNITEALRARGDLLSRQAAAEIERLRARANDGCTCGFGGQHDDINPRCDLNRAWLASFRS